MYNSYHLEGIEAFNQHDYLKAKTLFLQAINTNPEAPASYLFLGKSYFFCDEKKEAIAYLKKYIEFNQHNSEEISLVSYAFDLLGQCYEAEKKDSEAIRCYTTATKIYPSSASAWHNLGLLYIKSAQHYSEQDLNKSFKLSQGAQIFLKKALEICSSNPMFLHSVASWYEKYIEALEKVTEHEEAIQKNINNNYKLAIHYYQKALTACHEEDIGLKNIITSNLTECVAQYGHHLYKAEDFVKALECYSQAIELDPDHLIVMNQIGMSLFKLNRFAEARKYFTDILGKTSDPQELADAWLNSACTYRLEKSWANAEHALNKAKMLSPEDPCIFNEEKQLIESKSQASLIATPQTLFNNSSPISILPVIKITEPLLGWPYCSEKETSSSLRPNAIPYYSYSPLTEKGSPSLFSVCTVHQANQEHAPCCMNLRAL